MWNCKQIPLFICLFVKRRKLPKKTAEDSYFINKQNNEITFTSPKEYFVSLSPGSYKFQLWGASGGSTDDSQPGKGGFISGTAKILRQTKSFVFVGGKGNGESNTCIGSDYNAYHNISGGFNGGGHTWSTSHGSSGGGASDIRFYSDKLTERVIVAGGGGGAAFQGTGGNGGYPAGTDGSRDLTEHEGALGISGNQTSGGDLKECSLSYCILNNTKYIQDGFTNSLGSFGTGGNSIGRLCGGGAGGGGWFGGAGIYNSGGGGGGSSYIKSSIKLIDHQTGINEGDGKVIITFLSVIKLTCKGKTQILFSLLLFTAILLNK